jgi:Asp-tRNA(Asn)/Glu-tRNA(Gln) amidotransferase A subunit family amidase
LPRPFVESKFLGSDNTFPAVAVSSRLRSEPAKDKPLNGLRFAAKDNFNLKGIRTSFGSKAYLNTYGPQSETAETVKQLIGLGATITGKVKMTQFGNWEEPIQSADYQAPWNPRADGFQSPGGSSSGPAAALAAYEWLDVTLGSDSEFDIMVCLRSLN